MATSAIVRAAVASCGCQVGSSLSANITFKFRQPDRLWPFHRRQLKVIPLCIPVVVFVAFAYFYLGEPFDWRYAASLACILAAVGLAFGGRL